MSNIETALKKNIVEDPLAPRNYLQLGWHQHLCVEYDKAIRTYSCGIKICGCNTELHCKLGLTYHNEGKHVKAIQEYKKAIRADGSNYEARYYLGFILIQEVKYEEAIQHLKEAIYLEEEMDMAYYYLGIALEKTGRTREAIEILTRRIIKKKSKCGPQTLVTLSEILSRRRAYKTQERHEIVAERTLLDIIGKTTIHCFGDSHRAVFLNLENVFCHNVGAGTAYNLINKESSTGAGVRIFKHLEGMNPEEDAVLMVFGEIDCMEHIYKNKCNGNETLETLIEKLVERYIRFINQVRDKGYEVIVYGPSFSGYALNSHGTQKERNKIVKSFNALMEEKTNENNIIYGDINHLTIDSDYLTRMEISNDGRHLDNFPKESKVIQGIILSEFIKSANRIHNRLGRINTAGKISKDDEEFAYAITVDYKGNYCISQIKEKKRWTIRKNYKLAVLIIDEMTHRRIDQIKLDIKTTDEVKEIYKAVSIYAIHEKKVWQVKGDETVEIDKGGLKIEVKEIFRAIMIIIDINRSENKYIEEICYEVI